LSGSRTGRRGENWTQEEEKQESGHNFIVRRELRRLRQMGHTTHISEIRDAYKISVEKYELRDNFRGAGIDG
jgi:hypothetical protein